jgi:hypothetical protein
VHGLLRNNCAYFRLQVEDTLKTDSISPMATADNIKTGQNPDEDWISSSTFLAGIRCCFWAVLDRAVDWA